MSYILDALKKSEKERKLGSVPDIMTVQEIQPKGSKKRLLWILLILLFLLLNTAILIRVSPWKSEKPQPVSDTTSDKQIVAKSQNTSSDELSKTENNKVSTIQDGKTKKTQLTDSKISSESKNSLQQSKKLNAGKESKAIPETKIKREAFSTTPLKKEEASDVTSETKPEDNHLPLPLPNKIYYMSELPQSIQQKLPAFAISTFLYSEDPGSRSVRINGQMMREGQYLSAGLKLEEIMQNGMIFSYQNYRFQVGLK